MTDMSAHELANWIALGCALGLVVVSLLTLVVGCWTDTTKTGLARRALARRVQEITDKRAPFAPMPERWRPIDRSSLTFGSPEYAGRSLFANPDHNH